MPCPRPSPPRGSTGPHDALWVLGGAPGRVTEATSHIQGWQGSVQPPRDVMDAPAAAAPRSPCRHAAAAVSLVPFCGGQSHRVPPPRHPPRARGGSGALHGEGMGADGVGPPTAELGWQWGAEALPANIRVRQIPWSHTSSSPKSWGMGLSPPPRAGSPKPQDPWAHSRIPGCCPHPGAEPNTCHLPTTWPDTRYGGSPRHGGASPAS